MSKTECGLTLIVFVLLFFIAALSCYAWQQKKNEELMFEQIEKELVILKEKNQVQDDLIGSVIRTQAMAGMFDRKQ